MQVGRFVLERKLGSGGMGEVFLATDPDLKRQVALKFLLRESRSDESHRVRLQREAQAMARLLHPNVAIAHDVGSFRGQTFVAMEFIDGATLDEWVDERGRDWPTLRGVLLGAGRGLAAAHEAGLVHRDFKPSNVIVDGRGNAKVTDFGLARDLSDAVDEPPDAEAFDEELPDVAEDALSQTLTRTGTLLGTPRYMSPEQHDGRRAEAASDQFSYCLVLYECLYGEHPFPGSSRLEIANRIRRGDIADAPANARVPAWLRKVLLRGLRLDPEERWPSMEALLDALAHDPSARRRRLAGAVAMAALAAAAVVVTLLVANRGSAAAACTGADEVIAEVWNEGRSAEIRASLAATKVPYAADAHRRVDELVGTYARQWADLHTTACKATRVQKHQTEIDLGLRMACLDRRRSQLNVLLEQLENADRTVAAKAVAATARLPGLSLCSDLTALRRDVTPPADPEVAKRVEAARVKLQRVIAQRTTGKFAEGVKLATATLAEARALPYKPILAEAAFTHGNILAKTGEWKTAETSLREAIAVGTESRHDRIVAKASVALATVIGGFMAKYQEGLAFYERYAKPAVARVRSRELEAGLANAAGLMHEQKGELAKALEHYAEAVKLRRAIYGEGDPNVAYAMSNMSIVMREQGKYEQALDYGKRASAILSEALGPSHPDVAMADMNTAIVYAVTQRHAKAEAEFQRVLANWQKSLGAKHGRVAMISNNLGHVSMSLGKLDAAMKHYHRARSIWREQLGPDHPRMAMVIGAIGEAARLQNRFAEALTHGREALRIRVKALPPDHLEVGRGHADMGSFNLALGRCDEAIVHARKAVAILAIKITDDPTKTTWEQAVIGTCQLRQGKAGAAAKTLRPARAVCDRKKCDPETDALLHFSSAVAQWRTGGDRTQAVASANKALALLGGLPPYPYHKSQLARVRAWIAAPK